LKSRAPEYGMPRIYKSSAGKGEERTNGKKVSTPIFAALQQGFTSAFKSQKACDKSARLL